MKPIRPILQTAPKRWTPRKEDSSRAESFFDELEADNGVGRTLFIAGAVCIVRGVGGIVSIILWQRASRNRDSGEADRAEVLDEIEQEERRNRRRREEERMRREQMQARRETESRVPTSFDPDKDTGELPVMPVSAEYTAERPIMPETPVSMQPQNVRRAAVQTSVNRAPGKSPEAGCTDSADKACRAESARKI